LRTDLPDAVIPGAGRFFGIDHEELGGQGATMSRGGSWEGETSESFNPKDGFGMKKGRRGSGRGKRQEVEKT
jgi:hypothetical protein